ncbi:hypothetical protein ENVG_00281, partial [Emiliania huxleyi virus 84]
SQICEHNRDRSTCKECGGSQICEHNRERSTCKQCGGSQICEHSRRRNQCKECGGSQICEHNRDRSTCKQCGGSSICEHSRQRSKCKECGGASICEHNRERSNCKECGGASICEHNRQRRQCKECAPIGSKNFCQICCATMLSSHRMRQGIIMCAKCDAEVPQRTEHWIRDKLLQLGIYEPSAADDILFGGSECTEINKRRRPDLIWFGEDSRVLIVEIDEHSHTSSGYQPSCESAWISDMTDVCLKLNMQPPHVIRFNPDAYDAETVGINVRIDELYTKIDTFLTAQFEPCNAPTVEYMYYHSNAQAYIDHAMASEGIHVIT